MSAACCGRLCATTEAIYHSYIKRLPISDKTMTHSADDSPSSGGDVDMTSSMQRCLACDSRISSSVIGQKRRAAAANEDDRYVDLHNIQIINMLVVYTQANDV